MDAFLNVAVKILGYGDDNPNSNPKLRYADWQRDVAGMSVSDPKTEAHRLAPGDAFLLFNGARGTTVGNDTSFTVSNLSVVDPSRYRFTWNAGTNPTLRVGRSLTLTGLLVTFTVNSNATATVTLQPASPSTFSGVVAGDVVFVPHTVTGDAANVLSVLNAGYWQVLAAPDIRTLVMVRPTGVDFQAVSESVTLSSNAQFSAFSSNGVQVGDSVDISLGFSTGTRKSMEIVAVTDTFFEVVSTSPIASEVAVPTTAGIVFYSESKNFLYVETDQEAALRLNGDTSNNVRLAPVEAGNRNRPALFMKRGPTWSLTVVNRSTSVMNLVVIHAE